MNRFCLSVFLVLIFVQAYSQPLVLDFQKSYNFGINSTCYDFIKTSDSCFVFVGKDFGNGGDGNYSITKVNSLGDTLWRRIGDLYNGQACCISKGKLVVETSSGNYLIGGVYFPTPTSQIYLIMLDPSGNLIWEKIFGSPSIYMAVDGIVEIDHTFLLTCFYTDSGNTNHDFLMKINEMGDSLWSSTAFNYLISGYPESILKLTNNSFCIIGTEFDSTSLVNQARISIIDSLGVVGQAIIMTDSANMTGHKVYKLKDNTFILVLRYLNSNDFKIVKLDSAYNLIWHNRISTFSSTLSFAELDENSLVFIGSRDAIYVWRIDSTGTINFHDIIYFPANFVEVFDVVVSYGSKVLINGFYTNAQGGDPYIPFLVQLRDSTFLSTINSIYSNAELELFPVPVEMNKTLKIKLPGNAGSQQATVKIINLLGQILFHKELIIFDENDFEVSLEGIEKGNYMLVISANNRTHSNKFIIN